MEDRVLVGTNSTAPSREHRGQVTSHGLLQWPLTSSDPNGLLSGESEKSKRFHPRNVRTFYPQILRKSQFFEVRYYLFPYRNRGWLATLAVAFDVAIEERIERWDNYLLRNRLRFDRASKGAWHRIQGQSGRVSLAFGGLAKVPGTGLRANPAEFR